MTETTPPDPAAFLRQMLGQWETLANDWGGKIAKSGDFARTMQGATSGAMQAQGIAREAMGKMLAGANMPSKAEVEDLGGRLAAIEDRLARIETLLVKIAGRDESAPKSPKLKRTKQPPAKLKGG